MKKLFTFIIATLLLILPQTVFAAKPRPSPTPTPSPKIICVDAGHGGADTGATMTGVKGTITEAQENLDIAFRLQTLLAPTYQVVMTRTDNLTPTTTLGNTDRANICNSAGASDLVSIHLNGSTTHSIDYTEGLYGKQTKDKAWAQKINNAMILGIANHGITNFADGMLLKANMPATLAETVFISSDTEYALLTDGTGNRQQQIAQGLFNGITSQ